MKIYSPISCRTSSRRGSILLVSLVIAAAFALAVGSLVALLNTERRVNHAAVLKMKADYAVYSLLELGVQQVRLQVQNSGTPETGWTPTLSIHPSVFSTFFNADPATDLTAELSLTAAPTPVASYRWFDPEIPENRNDSMLGLRVLSTVVPLFAKVTLRTPGGQTHTSYASATLEVRGSPMFMYAAFFNMDLEAFAGGDMIFNGRVHANGNFTLSTNSATSFQVLYDNVTATGKFDDDPFFDNDNRGQTIFRLPDGTWRATGPLVGTGRWTDPSGTLIIASPLNTGLDFSGNPISFSSLQEGTNSTSHLYSEDKNWATLALNNFEGRIRTGEHGITRRSVPGMGDYVPKTRTTDAGFVNTAYQIIQPVRSSSDPALALPPSGDPNYAAKLASYKANWTREREKFAYKAGVRIVVDAPVITRTETYVRSGSRSQAIRTLDPAAITLRAETYQRGPDGKITYNSAGVPLTTSVTLPSDIFEIEPFRTEVRQEVRPNGSRVDTTLVRSGLRDNRRERGVNLVKLDVRKLKNFIDGSGTAPTWWNGGVYVEFPSAGAARAADGVQAGVDGMGLYLHNGGVTTTGNADVDRALPAGGLTIATNNVLYISGNYNADGILQPNSSATSDNTSGRTVEVSAAVAADAVVLLSNQWEGSGDPFTSSTARAGNETFSNEGRRPDIARPSIPSMPPNPSGTFNRRASNTEYSVAILAGQVPRDKITETGTQSNSTVANYLRFLEDWSLGGVTATVRGSIVALFECEIATQHLPGHEDIYTFPRRNYGFNELFTRRQPPLAPSLLDFKKIRYTHLTAAEFALLAP